MGDAAGTAQGVIRINEYDRMIVTYVIGSSRLRAERHLSLVPVFPSFSSITALCAEISTSGFLLTTAATIPCISTCFHHTAQRLRLRSSFGESQVLPGNKSGYVYYTPTHTGNQISSRAAPRLNRVLTTQPILTPAPSVSYITLTR